MSADGTVITLSEPLKHTHLGVTVTLPDGTLFEGRAEVGLLTRNIVVRGSEHQEWDETIQACPDGFNTGTVPLYRWVKGKKKRQSSAVRANVFQLIDRHVSE